MKVNKTFQYMYGGIPTMLPIKLSFRLGEKVYQEVWEEYQDNSFVQNRRYFCSLYKGNLPNMNPMKLFNYYIQPHETESNVDSLHGYITIY